MTTKFVQCAAGIAIVGTMLAVGCSKSKQGVSVSGQSQAPPSQEAPAQPVAARTAFWPMYTAAHQWAADVVVLRIDAKELPGYKNEAGKAALWEAVFASPSRHAYRTYTYAIAAVPPGIYKGVDAGLEMAWSGETRDAMAIDMNAFNVDSDAAYQAAATAAAEWLKKNPARPLTTIAMGDTYRFQEPVWYVVWGTKQNGYAAIVDANSGKVLSR